jgi:hypothetical protein
MADIITPATPHIDRPFGWKTWYVTPGTLTGTTDVTVATLPSGTIILDAKMVVAVADIAATSSAADLEMGAVGTEQEVLEGGADFGGTLGVTESAASDAALSAVNLVSLGGTAIVVNLEVIYVGAATTAPTYAVSLLCGRNDY